MKINLLKLTFSLALVGVAAAAQAQTSATLPDPNGGAAPVLYLRYYPLPQTPDAAGNDFTNSMVHCTPESYTNNQAAISTDQQFRVREEGPAKGATTQQNGPRIETRPPTTCWSTNPWGDPDYPWAFDNYMTQSTSH